MTDKLIRKFTSEDDEHTKVVRIYRTNQGVYDYVAIGSVEGVDCPTGAKWQSNDLYEIIDNAKYWL